MANAFIEKLKEWFRQVQNGPVGKFFYWWLGELRGALPLSWQQKLQHALRRVTLGVDEESVQVGVDENRTMRLLDSFPLSHDARVQQQQIDDLLMENDLPEAQRFLLLDSGDVLRKQITLPAAAEANLSQVLAFEMDRHTPFRASSVYFDWKILQHNADTGQIQLEIFVVPRASVDQARTTLQARGLVLGGVDILEGDKTLGLNLFPVDQRTRMVNRKVRMNFALGAVAAVLLGLVMTQSLYLRAHQLTALEAAIAEVQGEARRVQNIKEQISESSEEAAFLTVRRESTPLAIEVLTEVTRVLPDDTYLDRLVIGLNSVQMQGKSQNAQQLIERVNESSLLNQAAFRGSTRLDARTGLEIFEVNAMISTAGDG